MNRKQAADRWEVSLYQVSKICKYLGISTKDIPEDTVPVYIPDGRYKKDPHRFYIFVLDVIINSHLELKGVDPTIIETCVEKLRNTGLIVLKRGRDVTSVDYHDYMISPDRDLFYNWKESKMKAKMEVIRPVISAISEGVAAGTELAGALV